MKLTETIKATPLKPQSTLRRDEKRIITSADAGKVIPVACVPLLREDRVARGDMRVRFEMMETAELLMNAVTVNVYAHFIPYLASDRFNGMDQLNRSYEGVPEYEGGAVVPFIDQIAFDRTAEFWSTLGVHAKNGTNVNAFPLEAYNILVNWRRKARSEKLPQRLMTDTSLARAFWNHSSFSHIVPDFDQAMVDGEVELKFSTTKFPVRGLGVDDNETTFQVAGGSSIKMSGGDDATGWHMYRNRNSLQEDDDRFFIKAAVQDGAPDIWAEVKDMGVRVSLANIELAKKTAAFARIRERYADVTEDHIIDLLMDGIRVPDEQMSQPILLDRKRTIFGYNQRYATDAANLSVSATNGETFVDLRMRTPPMNTGGVILVTAEVVPEQMFERQKDYYLAADGVDKFPQFMRDILDPEKVAIVQNDHVDVEHSTPTGTFGYAPLNHEWHKRQLVNIGGKYYRPTVDAAFDEERQKFWAAETLDPALAEDFYLCTDLHKKPFADTTADPVEIMARGRFDIVGHTVFGDRLLEDNGDYLAVEKDVDTSRIDQNA